MLYKIWRFLVLLEAVIPPGKDQHHNFSLHENNTLTLWLMMGKEYIPISFEPSDEDLSPEQLVNNIFNIPFVQERLKNVS